MANLKLNHTNLSGRVRGAVLAELPALMPCDRVLVDIRRALDTAVLGSGFVIDHVALQPGTGSINVTLGEGRLPASWERVHQSPDPESCDVGDDGCMIRPWPLRRGPISSWVGSHADGGFVWELYRGDGESIQMGSTDPGTTEHYACSEADRALLRTVFGVSERCVHETWRHAIEILDVQSYQECANVYSATELVRRDIEMWAAEGAELDTPTAWWIVDAIRRWVD